ncbi:MAG: alpha/beta hydrolase fold domain-containing protein [Candidatus Hodarchaeales archaeon]|jgi:acetyl esterase/lipase
MKKSTIFVTGLKFIGLIVLIFILFLLLPYILRNILDQLFLVLGVTILSYSFVICLGFLLFLIGYYWGVQKHILRSNIILEYVCKNWRTLIAFYVLSFWGIYILGFSPSAYWLGEYNFWIGAILVVMLILLAIRMFLTIIIFGNSLELSKFQILTNFSAFILVLIVFFPFFQVTRIIPIVSTDESLEFNSDSDLIPLLEKSSKDVFFNDFHLTSSEIRIEKDIDYNNHSSLDVYYLPRKNKSNPIVIVLYGGGWISGSKNIIPIVSVSKFFALHGFTVFSINYRLFPHAIFLEMLHDVRDAIVFSKSNAFKYHGDKNRTFLFGRSAGAQLALVAAYGTNVTLFKERSGNYTYSDLKITGVASIYGISEVSTWASRILDVSTGEDTILYELASPISYVNKSGLVPTFLSAGTLDALVPVKNSRILTKALSETKNDYMYLEIPWANHAYDGMISSLSSQITLYYFLTFFSHYT